MKSSPLPAAAAARTTLLGLLLLALLPPAQATRNPCCSNPCQHRGICIRKGFDQYECDCTRTGYYGRNCNTPEIFTWLKVTLKPSPTTAHYILTHFKVVWNIINYVPYLRKTIMAYLLTSRSNLIESPPTYNSAHGYKSWEVIANLSYYARALPPVPSDCPTPLGVKGRKVLPDSKSIVERLLLRRKFVPDPQGTNLMFAFFAQHFTHQFFKTDHYNGPSFTKAIGHGVDLNHVYGVTLERQRKLRLHKYGKLKYQMINGEMYPLTVKETHAEMAYAPQVPEHLKFSVGHEIFGLVPGLMMYAILWLREHNRVCDVLMREHPEWEDEQLFQTARLILIGETIKIVIEDYVQHLSGYYFDLKFDPELLFSHPFQYQNRITAEFNILYHWHSLLPDTFLIQDEEYGYQQFMFNNSILLDHGISEIVRSFSRQRAGRISGGRNIPSIVQNVAKNAIDHCREMRFQSLNAYRKHFQLKPFKSFEDLTGEKELAAELEELYGDIDAVEFYPGLIVEKPHHNGIFGETMIEIGAPFSLKGLMGNPICSPEYWKPSTFGGKVGFDIVNTASIYKLVCNNAKGCPVTAFHILNPKTATTINVSTSRAARDEVNPTTLLKKQYAEL